MFAGRFLQGMWTGGQQTVEQAYISECIDKDRNLGMISELGAVAVMGFILGPIIGYGSSLIEFTVISAAITSRRGQSW